jgi:Cu/Ag efflux protein CusF
MMCFASSRIACWGIVLALTVAMSTGSAMAQAQVPPPRPADQPIAGMFEGSVQKIDPAAGTVQVGWGPSGALGRTLEVTGDTKIQVEGRQGTLADVREGAKVKASYESFEGKNVAKEIEVMAAEADAGQPPVKRLPAEGGEKTGAQPPTKTQ